MNTTPKFPKVIFNAARCKGCGHILQSVHVHDYRTHTCEKEVDGTDKKIYFMVDGGLDYVRRGWAAGTRPDQNYEDLSMYEEPKP